MITGAKVDKPSKAQLAKEVAKELRLPEPEMSSGATVLSEFLEAAHIALTGGRSSGANAYRKTERLMNAVGLTYDPYWDTSESSDTGGSTVTARAFSRIRSALTGVPCVFILNTTDAPVGARWETDHHTVYRYDGTVTGRVPLNEAGPGTRILYYSTRNSSQNKMSFVAHAEVQYIAPGWTGPWEAQLAGYTEFATPVPVSDVNIMGWNRQHAITEIAWDTYVEILTSGGVGAELDSSAPAGDPGGDVVASRVLNDFPAATVASPLHVPATLPVGAFPMTEPVEPRYEESPDGSAVAGPPSMPPRTPSQRRKDRLAEQRAVELTTEGLTKDGWRRSADRQKDGVGYDLEFRKGGRRLKVEVKGIQGSDLVFNLTPKEAWRAETDPDWIVVAVTGVLSPRAAQLHLLTREKVAAARRVVVGYRLTVK